MAKKRRMREIIDTINVLCPGSAEAILAGIFDPLDACSAKEAKDFIDNNIKILTQRLESMKSSFNIDEAQAFDYMSNRANFSHDEWEVVKSFSFEMSRLGEGIVDSVCTENLEIKECKEELKKKKSALKTKAKRSKWLQA